MRVIVCDFTDNENEFIHNWNAIKAYILEQAPDLLSLPEMPFCSWIAVRYVVYLKPMLQGSKYYNTAFVYEKEKGHREINTKYYFPNWMTLGRRAVMYRVMVY